MRSVSIIIASIVGMGCSGSGNDADAPRDSGARDVGTVNPGEPDADSDARPPRGDGGTPSGPSDVGDFTFFVWSDLQIKEGDSAHLDAVRAANELHGTGYPEAMGGKVDQPAFVLDAGDAVEWPSWAAVREYERVVDEVSRYPVWLVLGNHDLTGTSGSPVLENWYLERYTDFEERYDYEDPSGAPVDERSYSFEHEGVAFVGLVHTYDGESGQPAQPVRAADREWLGSELDRYGSEMPIVVWLHLGIDSIVNREEVTALFEGHQVVLVAGGHFSYAKHEVVQGYDFIQVGAPQPSDSYTPTFVTVRFDAGTMTVATWNFDEAGWHDAPRFTRTLR